ncbi:hypothetical protein OUZ56_029362 [Daphnia magna]|uniref:Uncharacterized protein n=1 Tax=Daphnia magna TaxID=35525 RepID=A0ABR0B6M0_9CRUS|nr:hypothetical protein OUZ56_029362 [Daphnia magna]
MKITEISVIFGEFQELSFLADFDKNGKAMLEIPEPEPDGSETDNLKENLNGENMTKTGVTKEQRPKKINVRQGTNELLLYGHMTMSGSKYETRIFEYSPPDGATGNL